MEFEVRYWNGDTELIRAASVEEVVSLFRGVTSFIRDDNSADIWDEEGELFALIDRH